jgi:adenine-specific DNA-methyltransferase
MHDESKRPLTIPAPQHVLDASVDFRIELLARLRDAVPEAFAEGKLDLELLKALVGDAVETRPERYEFNWAGKRDSIAMLQAPTRATLIPDRVNSVDFDDAQHVFIEGENLDVLKVLYRSYFGRVKLIYIDPPYNTGNDFVYPDNFADPLDHYLCLTGQKSGNGDYLTSQPERSGRFHSSWLSMMYPRLSLARQLLQDDGVIVVSIDDSELPSLRRLMEEVFGEEGFVAQFVWKSRKFPDSRSTTQVSVDHEYIIAYRRSTEGQFRGVERDETKFQNPDNDPRGAWMSRSILGLATAQQRPNLHYPITDPRAGISFDPPADRGWRYSKARMHKLIEEGCILFPSKAEGRPREKKFQKDLQNVFMAMPSIIDDVHTSDGTDEIRAAFGFQAFDFPKPSSLIRKFVEQLTTDDDTIIDFFAGSCSTAHAVIEQNRRDGRLRRYICVQFPEQCNADSEAAKRGYRTIADIGRHRIKSVIAGVAKARATSDPLDLQNGQHTGFRAFKLAASNIRRWTGLEDKKPDIYTAQLEAFTDTLVSGWKSENVIWEVALREGFSLTARIEKLNMPKSGNYWRVTDTEQDRAFSICLDNTLTLDAVQMLGLSKDDHFVCRDVALDDTLAANLALQCRLKVI